MVRIQSPSTNQYYDNKTSTLGKYSESLSQKRALQPKPTFDCYSDPKGPDIKLGKIGPEYKTTTYQHKEYRPMTPYKPRPSSVIDPLKSRPSYIDRPVAMYKGDVTYRLNEDNNAGMRHWNYGFVEDTVAAKRTQRPQTKYTVQEKSKPKQEYKKPTESKPKQKPITAAVVPLQKRQTPPPPPPPAPVAKSYRTSQTQTQVSKTKTLGTQYGPEKTKSISVQTNSSTPSLPVLAPVPIPQSTRKVTTKGTQSDGPKVRASDTLTTPLTFQTRQFIPVHTRTTPQYIEESRQETPVYKQKPTPSPVFAKNTRWTHSPEVVQPVPATFKPPSPKTSYPDYSTSQSTYNAGQSSFPYQTTKSHLPPEITACIEAYDNAHGPI